MPDPHPDPKPQKPTPTRAQRQRSNIILLQILVLLGAIALQNTLTSVPVDTSRTSPALVVMEMPAREVTLFVTPDYAVYLREGGVSRHYATFATCEGRSVQLVRSGDSPTVQAVAEDDLPSVIAAYTFRTHADFYTVASNTALDVHFNTQGTISLQLECGAASVPEWAVYWQDDLVYVQALGASERQSLLPLYSGCALMWENGAESGSMWIDSPASASSQHAALPADTRLAFTFAAADVQWQALDRGFSLTHVRSADGTVEMWIDCTPVETVTIYVADDSVYIARSGYSYRMATVPFEGERFHASPDTDTAFIGRVNGVPEADIPADTYAVYVYHVRDGLSVDRGPDDTITLAFPDGTLTLYQMPARAYRDCGDW